ncbi:BREX-1 system adenine-specific DNA-methyltransferase PglX, partial [Escherichia coli]|uniref:BREX-1 system adenine-specific DNA-methyltransferase PglX n=1 Tax=Escherichia coli TaxID=562 RepID=UPI0019D28315
KVVKREDIPAATQLFTPNWIVQYLVQNSVGRQWLQTYPDSSLKAKMPYYIEPAEQTPEVQAQLAAITPSSIEPESIKVLDPACGSGHILTEAYNVLKAIYEERGYRTRDIPQLILENNIFGLDIDDRAAQLSGFAMLMLARLDDRRILSPGRSVRLNIVSLQESKLDIAELWTKLNFHQQVQRGSMGDMFAEGTALANTDSVEYKLLMRTLALFTSAKTLGSLIQVPQEDETALKTFLGGLYRLAVEGDIPQKEAAAELIPYIQQAWILAQRYDAVVANPPYMGGKGMNGELKEFAKKQFPDSKSDLFAMFIERGFSWLKDAAYNSMVTMQSWMFLSSYENMRANILDKYTIETMVHMGNGVMKIAFGTNATVFRNVHIPSYQGAFSYTENDDINDEGYPKEFPVKNDRLKTAAADDFKKIPGSPIAYWVNEAIRDNFAKMIPLESIAPARQGLGTGNNAQFVRFWFEVSNKKIHNSARNKNEAYSSGCKWFPYTKGGGFKKWYGNDLDIVNWENDGAEIRLALKGMNPNIPRSEEHYFKKGITWGLITSSEFSARYADYGAVFDVGGSKAMPSSENLLPILGLLNTKVTSFLLKTINPTLNFQVGDMKRLPILDLEKMSCNNDDISRAIDIAKTDWNGQEIAKGFKKLAITSLDNNGKVSTSWSAFKETSDNNTILLQEIEQKLNSFIIKEYGADNLISPDVPLSDITLENNPHYLYKSSEGDFERYRCDIFIALISYSVGCMVGRYSLDREGLVYAHEGNKGFSDLAEEGAYKTFPADEDGILPLMDSDWFDDDVTARVKEFVRTVWGEEHLQDNLNFIAESLCLYAIKPKKGESSLDTIRRYLSTQFWKEHMKMYKKRPIYWLFSSGKEKAFECLVYLHRYNEGTLSRMRTEYVVPLLARYQGNIDLVNDQLKSAESGATTTRLKKELDGLTKKFNELRNFDDRLRHYADMRITIDLDDGVKVNYGKFGDLLADVKAITGSAPQEA